MSMQTLLEDIKKRASALGLSVDRADVGMWDDVAREYRQNPSYSAFAYALIGGVTVICENPDGHATVVLFVGGSPVIRDAIAGIVREAQEGGESESEADFVVELVYDDHESYYRFTKQQIEAWLAEPDYKKRDALVYDSLDKSVSISSSEDLDLSLVLDAQPAAQRWADFKELWAEVGE